MCLICSGCIVCGAPYGTHYDWCEVPTRDRPPPPRAVPAAVALEGERAKALDAWLRGAPVPTRGGYQPPESPEVM